ncbi:MAG: hypothetical protein AAF206_23210 [Bacteroidota bacterium]
MTRFAPAFTLLLLLNLSSFGQNIEFLPFGTSPMELKAHISQLLYFRGQLRENDHTLSKVISNRHQVHYDFHDNRLYAVQDERQYTNRKQAEKTIDACLQYFYLLDTMSVDIVRTEEKVEVVAITSDRTLRLEAAHDPMDGSSTIRLISTSFFHGPERDASSYAHISRKTASDGE